MGPLNREQRGLGRSLYLIPPRPLPRSCLEPPTILLGLVDSVELVTAWRACDERERERESYYVRSMPQSGMKRAWVSLARVAMQPDFGFGASITTKRILCVPYNPHTVYSNNSHEQVSAFLVLYQTLNKIESRGGKSWDWTCPGQEKRRDDLENFHPLEVTWAHFLGRPRRH